MKIYLQKFFKSKLNILLVASQVLALFFLCFASTGKWAYILTLVLEGLFFVFLGCKQIAKNKELDNALEIQSRLKIENIDMEKQNKRAKITKRGNVFQAILYFLMGLILIIIALF